MSVFLKHIESEDQVTTYQKPVSSSPFYFQISENKFQEKFINFLFHSQQEIAG